MLSRRKRANFQPANTVPADIRPSHEQIEVHRRAAVHRHLHGSIDFQEPTADVQIVGLWAVIGGGYRRGSVIEVSDSASDEVTSLLLVVTRPNSLLVFAGYNLAVLTSVLVGSV